MIFLDSWVWIEFFQEDEKSEQAQKVIEEMQQEGGVITSLVLTEVRYQMRRKFGEQKADEITALITSFDALKIMPVTEEVAVYAADLRHKYYERSSNQISYADTIHIATAKMAKCDKLYTGDSDFDDIEEVEIEII